MRIQHLLFLLLLLSASICSAYTFGQNKINLKTENWSTLQTMHFDIFFPAGEDVFGKTVALMSEETYYQLRADLTFPAGARIPLIFYRNKTQFQDTNIIYPLLTESVGGFTESLRNRVVIPFDGSYANLEKLLVHELTHAYTNSLDKDITGSNRSLRAVSFPYWFSEGLPEFLSIGGEDDYNNMFILDMVVNDDLQQLENASGYYAYRLGESFLGFIAKIYGRDKVFDYYYALRAANSLDDATKKVFGMEFKDLESRWQYQLKRDYYPLVNSHDIPGEKMEQRTDSDKDGSYFNFMPRFSPDGEQYVYFSTAGARYSIWMNSLAGLSKPEKILTGETTGAVEEFHYFRSNLSWFPDNRRVAFAAKSANGDRINVLDVETKKIVQSIAAGVFEAIYELDVSPTGNRIVFAAQHNMQCDLYEYNLDSGNLIQLTDDLFNDAQPRYLPDGQSIVFTSERNRDKSIQRKGFFADLVNQIYTLDISNGSMTQLTFEHSNCSFPALDSTGTKLVFISSEEGVKNLFAVDLVAHTKAKVTDILSGVLEADLSQDGRHLILSNFFRGAWDLFYLTSPLDSLQYQPYPAPTSYRWNESLLQEVDLSKLDYYGKRQQPKLKRKNPAGNYALRDPFLMENPEFEFAPEDSLQLNKDFSYDDRPQTKDVIPAIKPYKTKFSLDSLWGGLAYSPSVGTIGYVELSMSDQMGNHGIGINAGVSGKLEESNILLTYLYLKQRMDYGIGLYNTFDEIIFRDDQSILDDYYKYNIRQTGVYFLMRYPLSRFFRIELDHMLYQRGQYLSNWIWDTSTTGHWGEQTDLGQDIVYTPGLTLVQDNSLYGSTGPLLGWRAMYNISTTLADGKIEYVTNYLDWRSYTLFSKRYAIALRAIAGVSTGESPQYFDLSGYNGVRGYSGDLTGTKKALVSAELRFPFFEYINLAFPIPLNIPNIRGTLFADVGTVFSDFDSFQGVENGKLKDLYMSYGFGPRLDLGYVVLRLDIAWLTDLESSSKPTFYLSLSEDF